MDQTQNKTKCIQCERYFKSVNIHLAKSKTCNKPNTYQPQNDDVEDICFTYIKSMQQYDTSDTTVHTYILEVSKFIDMLKREAHNTNTQYINLTYGLLGTYEHRVIGNTNHQFVTQTSIKFALKQHNVDDYVHDFVTCMRDNLTLPILYKHTNTFIIENSIEINLLIAYYKEVMLLFDNLSGINASLYDDNML